MRFQQKYPVLGPGEKWSAGDGLMLQNSSWDRLAGDSRGTSRRSVGRFAVNFALETGFPVNRLELLAKNPSGSKPHWSFGTSFMKFFELHFFLFFSSSAAGFLALFVRPSVRPCGCPPVRPPVGPSECPYVQPSALLSVGLSARPLVLPSARPPVPSFLRMDRGWWMWIMDIECESWISNMEHGEIVIMDLVWWMGIMESSYGSWVPTKIHHCQRRRMMDGQYGSWIMIEQHVR